MQERTFEEDALGYIDYLQHVRQYSTHTSEGYSHDLRLFGEFLEASSIDHLEISSREVRSFVSSLKRRGYADASIHRIVSALKGFYRYADSFLGHGRNPFLNVRSSGSSKRLPTVLTPEEVHLWISAPSEDFTGRRDRALFHLLYSTGCRLSEMLAMSLGDISLKERRILVHGKGGKDRYVFLTTGAADDVSSYLDLRQEHLRGKVPIETSVFVNKQGKRLTPQGVHYIFHTYAERLNTGKHVTPHTFRHTFATHLLDHGAGIRAVQELLGHEQISTTQIYAHVSAKRLQKVYEAAHPHGRRTDEF